ncbi:MAG: hypothetical protein CSA42_06550 [Gammaproteobacteria bacterium]|nr:MAG: hypothetical protein CSA42_06550 [Gammaproteobacteria bacterium]
MIKIKLFKVRGHSMFPNFLPDSFVLVIKYPWQQFKVGDVVLVKHEKYGKMIKRICSMITSKSNSKIGLNRCKKITLRGDNPQSVTTEQMGQIDSTHIIGKVIYQIKPPTK